ncbi:hypothetical protein IB62_013765 [Xanthomonas euvesicatoria]|nr:hypothetical protein IB62_013765 [Xanthomonas euvesicatoria]
MLLLLLLLWPWPWPWPWPWILLHPVALKRAEHRSHGWPKRRPCLSVASLGAVPRVARSAGDRCGLIAEH